MQSDKSCALVEHYLAYLKTVKGRSPNTILEYRLDLLQFFLFTANERGISFADFHLADLGFIRSIQLGDMYTFLAYCQETLNAAPNTMHYLYLGIKDVSQHDQFKTL